MNSSRHRRFTLPLALCLPSLIAGALLISAFGCSSSGPYDDLDCVYLKPDMAEGLPTPLPVPNPGLYYLNSGLEASSEECPGSANFIVLETMTFPDEFYPSFEVDLPVEGVGGEGPIAAECEFGAYSGGSPEVICLGRSEEVYRPDAEVAASFAVEFTMTMEFDPDFRSECGHYLTFLGTIEGRAVGECEGLECEGEPGLGACMMDITIGGVHEDLRL